LAEEVVMNVRTSVVTVIACLALVGHRAVSGDDAKDRATDVPMTIRPVIQ